MNSLILLIGAVAVVLLLLIVAVIVATVLIVRSRNQANPVGPVSQTPLDVLKLRYARGEINREQYEAMRRDSEAR